MNETCTPSRPAASTVVAPCPLSPLPSPLSPAVAPCLLFSLSPCLFSLASGVLMAACYQPFNLHWLAWIALVPWLVVLPRLPAEKVWPYGLLVGLGYYGMALAWLCKLSWMIGPMVIFWFILLLGFSFRVARLLMDRYGAAAMIWAMPLAFVGQEVLRSEAHGRLRFAFAGWGYSQAHNLWVAQIASLGGVYFLSFLLVMFNAAVAYGLIRTMSKGIAGCHGPVGQRSSWLWLIDFIWPQGRAASTAQDFTGTHLVSQRVLAWTPAAGIGAAIVILGVLAQPPSYEGRQAVRVACVQSEAMGYMHYTRCVEQAARNDFQPAIVVMPEHALLDVRPDYDPELQSLADLARATQTYICAAGDARVTRPGTVCPFDNKAMLIDPAGKTILEQLKSVPLPYFRDGNPATMQDIARTPHGVVGIYICYDATFTDLPRRLVMLGAELLLGPVMDAAHWGEQQRRQHADIAIFRAIELRRCIVRAASSGISQIIDATGRVTALRTNQEGPGLLFGEVYPVQGQTAFVRGGWLFAPAVCITFLMIVAVLTLTDWRDRFYRRYQVWWQLRRQQSLTVDPMGLLQGLGTVG